MIVQRFVSCPLTVVTFSLILVAGCTPSGKKVSKVGMGPREQKAAAQTTETVTVALKFTPGDLNTYRVITKTKQGVEWRGDVPNEPVFKGGTNETKTEIVFTEQIQSVDDKGDALKKITIKELKYVSKIRGKIAVDFDSSRKEDQNNPLTKLIGQSYTVQINPKGEVKEIDAKQARDAIVSDKTGSMLLSSEAIKRRHGTLVLPGADAGKLTRGKYWTSIKTFFFGKMGVNSYERVYTLKEIKNEGGLRVAIVEMNAIPSAEMEENFHKDQQTADFSKGFDNTATYTGQLKFDLNNGVVETYSEDLQSKWVSGRLAAKTKDKGLIALTMSARRSYALEKID